MARIDRPDFVNVAAPLHVDQAWRLAQLCRERNVTRPKLIADLLAEGLDRAGVPPVPGARP